MNTEQNTQLNKFEPRQYSSNYERLANYHRISGEEAKRLYYNAKMIGQKVFCVSFGGWYGIVKDMGYHIDEFMVQRPTGKVFPVSIYDIRVLDYNTQEEEPAPTSNDIFDNI